MQMPATDDKPMRFYHVILEKDLLGGWTLIRESGYQGSSGRVTRAHFNEWDEAQQAFEHTRDAQTRKGFRTVFVDGLQAP